MTKKKLSKPGMQPRTLTALEQAKFLKSIAPNMKHEYSPGYLMVNKNQEMKFVSGGKEYVEAVNSGYREVLKIDDVKDNLYFMEYCPVEEFIDTHYLEDFIWEKQEK